MLGWEFPPFFAGGVGVVCEAMTRALARRGTEVTYLMPRAPGRDGEPGLRIVSPGGVAPGVEVVALPSVLVSYATQPGARILSVPGEPRAAEAASAAPLYGPNLDRRLVALPNPGVLGAADREGLDWVFLGIEQRVPPLEGRWERTDLARTATLLHRR